jgi:tetratricopeptide (TPR) repeat protein
VYTAPDISRTAAAALADLPESDTGPLLDELDRVHLINEVRPGRYAFHDLLREYANELARKTGRDAALTRLLDHYLAAAHSRNFFAVERDALIAAVAQAHDEGKLSHAWRLAQAITEHLDRAARWHDLATVQRIALAAAARAGDRHAEARARYDLGFASTHLGCHHEALDHLQAALDGSAALGDRTGQARAHLELARVKARVDRHRAALDHASRALDLLEAADDVAGQARALNAVGWYLTLLGEHHRALALCRRAIALHQSLGNERGEAGTWQSLGHANHHLGRHDEAVRCYDAALAGCRALGDRYNEADTLLYLGDAHRACGDHGAAATAWRQALGILRMLNDPDIHRARDRLRSVARSGAHLPSSA